MCSLTVLPLLALSAAPLGFLEKETVLLEFLVTVPAETPPEAKIYLAGNIKALGLWLPGGVELTRLSEGKYSGSVEVPRGARLEFKVTQGTWESVETLANGTDIPNRKHSAAADGQVRVEVERWLNTKPRPQRPPTITGDLRVHAEIPSKILGYSHKVSVLLPPGYARLASERYPVLYLQDGQNLFDESRSATGVEWQVDETVMRLIQDDRLRPIIVVGIDNTPKRIDEYTATRSERLGSGGQADSYARFLVEELKPFIDTSYRTLPGREATAIGGSSLGALLALHVARQHRTVFGACLAMSPSLWWDERKLLHDWALDPGPLKGIRFWVDIGTHEGVAGDRAAEVSPAVQHCRELAQVFDSAKLVPGRDYYYSEILLAGHNEAAWAARLDKALLFFYGK